MAQVDDDVRAIRERCEMTRKALAEFMRVHEDTVRKWKDGTNKPNGPASLVLEMLAVWPNLPALLDTSTDAVPMPKQYPEGAPSWRRVREVLAHLDTATGNVAQQADVRKHYALGRDWIDAAMSEGLMGYGRGDTFKVTEFARQCFDISGWYREQREKRAEDG